MQRSPLIFGLAAVFAGLTVLLAVVGLVYRELVVVLVALPIGAAAYLFWYHATGRLRASVRRRATRNRRGDRTAGVGRGSRTAWEPPRTDRADAGFDAGRTGAGPRPPADAAGPSVTEARRVLGVGPGADDSAVRRAYREKVKEVHPDTDGGSERAFKEVQAAYQRLTN